MSKESLWILENPKLHISMRVGSPAEHSVTQSIWKYDCQIQSTFERNIQLNSLSFNFSVCLKEYPDEYSNNVHLNILILLEYSSGYSLNHTLELKKQNIYQDISFKRTLDLAIIFPY